MSDKVEGASAARPQKEKESARERGDDRNELAGEGVRHEELEELLAVGDYDTFRRRAQRLLEEKEGCTPQEREQIKALQARHLGRDGLAVGMVMVVAVLILVLGVIWVGGVSG